MTGYADFSSKQLTTRIVIRLNHLRRLSDLNGSREDCDFAHQENVSSQKQQTKFDPERFTAQTGRSLFILLLHTEYILTQTLPVAFELL